jgi:excisionase family DNA binding protein
LPAEAGFATIATHMTEELSPREAAARIGTTPRTIQRWIEAGRLPARRVGGRLRVASVALDAFVAGTTAEPGTNATPRRQQRADLRRIFVANRGEIAGRIRHTVELGGGVALIAGDAGLPEIDLLDIESVVAAAQSSRAEAVHPGYGFLAESAPFARAVEEAGLRWIGPPASAIERMGDKAAARRLAASLGIPVVPGYDGSDQTDAAIRRAARRIGAPLLVKPAAGGGGKGMHIVRDLKKLPDALAAARREARTAFGNERLILERLVEGPRHIEIQVLFDAHGDGIHMGERDCSLQRRHQKILEESPSPAVRDDLRARLGAAALRLAAAVGYRSAGTCEFLVADDGTYFFLEMNTRLQVEHPVTELVTGRDLVADQIAIAGGATLADIGLDQSSMDARLTTGGHAVEARLYAEDAEDGFLPATGRVELLRWPPGAAEFERVGPAGVRVDAGIEQGTDVGPRFDPMLAKVITFGRDRREALDRLTRALDDALVLGLTTNLRFLRWLVREPAVRDGQSRIDTLDRIWPPDDWVERVAPNDDIWRTAAGALLGQLARERPSDPWTGGWRANADPVVRLETDGDARSVPVRDVEDAPAVVVADGVAHVDVAGRSVSFRLAPPPDVDRAARAATVGAGTMTIEAPMPGSVLAVHVALGQPVEPGDPIVTLEAMKMEHVVAATATGVVADLAVRPADQVTRGQLLAVIGEPGAMTSAVGQ